MAGEYLRSQGIDVDAEMSRIQFGNQETEDSSSAAANNKDAANTVDRIINASLPKTEAGTTWDLAFSGGKIESITPHQSKNQGQDQPSSPGSRTINAHSALCAPSLCHPHIHLDKAYLLSHPKYSHLQVQGGDFKEAMTLTGEAKASFERPDLLERGQRLIDESVAAGVTHMRAFVEVDAIVGTTCLEAGLELKRRAEGRCVVQICAFAQLPLFSASQSDEEGSKIRGMMEAAAANEDVDVIGSTPYVESSRSQAEQNVNWMVELSASHSKPLDFHLDYNLDAAQEPLIWHVISSLTSCNWLSRTRQQPSSNAPKPSPTIVLGHCTRLTLFQEPQWTLLAQRIHASKLPLHFVGLPTSDLYMSATGPASPRGTLPLLHMIKQHHVSACIGLNNLGNAFTPYGAADPLFLASLGVGVYGAGPAGDAGVLWECVSTRAREAIGFGRGSEEGGGKGKGGAYRNGKGRVGLGVREGDRADLVVLGAEDAGGWRTRKGVAEAVYLYDGGRGRRGVLGGRVVE